MLVIIVGVTTILLLIMGTVSTYLFVRRVDGQTAAATRRLNQLATTWLRSRRFEAEVARYAQTGYSVVGSRFSARRRGAADHRTGDQGSLQPRSADG